MLAWDRLRGSACPSVLFCGPEPPVYSRMVLTLKVVPGVLPFFLPFTYGSERQEDYWICHLRLGLWEHGEAKDLVWELR